MSSKKLIVVKVLGYGDIQEHRMLFSTFDDLDSFLLHHVDGTGNFEIKAAATRRQITPETFSDLMTLDEAIVHVTKAAESPETPLEGSGHRSTGQALFMSDLEFAREESTGWQPSLKWKIPDDLTTLKHFLVVITDEPRGQADREATRLEVQPPGGGRRAIELGLKEQFTENTHRAEVHAVSTDDSIVESKLVRFVAERFTPGPSEWWSAGGNKLLPELGSFALTKSSAGPTFLLVGKQHHGKSSVINHFNRCLRGNLDSPDVVRAAPAGELETTTRTHKVAVPVHGMPQPPVWFLDVPAFATMNEERKADLQNLLWNASHNTGRGEGGCVLPKTPDGVIVVVSLLALRDERMQVQEYLHILQEALQRFPFVVAATHKDVFFCEEGNEGKDPLEELREALEDLCKMANTSQVFAIANYRQRSLWSGATDGASVELLRQLMSNAIQRAPTAAETKMETGCILLVLALVAAAFALLVALARS